MIINKKDNQKNLLYVIARSRAYIDTRILDTIILEKEPGYHVRSFTDLTDARTYLHTGFFDDSDYNIYTSIKGKWYIYKENFEPI